MREKEKTNIKSRGEGEGGAGEGLKREINHFEDSKKLIWLQAEVEMDYYEGGGSLGLPVVFVPNLNSTAAVFYRQIEFLAEKNVRSIALSIPALFDPTSVVKAMDVFVEECLRLDGQIHLVGSGFGGYLCQLYTELRPQKVCFCRNGFAMLCLSCT